MKSLLILKIGGKVIEEEPLLDEALTIFAQQEGPKILIHGGGKRASQVSKQLGIPVQMVNGRRVTDAATLEVAVMVYAGWANKLIVAKLQGLGKNAIGLCGADANTILSHQRPFMGVDYGFAGDVDVVNITTIETLLQGNLVPVFCAITHNGKGQLLNTNADTIATQLATALSSQYNVQLNFCFEKPGVLRNPMDDNSVIPTLSAAAYRQFQTEGVITEGMLPKLDNAFEALQNGVHEVRIGDVASIVNKTGTLLEI